MLKRIYHVLGWLAVANLFAVGGLVGYLFGSGRLNAERINQIAVVLRGEFPKPQVQTSQPVVNVEKPQTSREELAALEKRKRFYELISDRRRRDLEDRNALGQTIQLDVNRQMEQIATKQQEITAQKQQIQTAMSESGMQQALEIYSSMEPKLALGALMGGKDADALQILMQMDAGRRKKIVNTCKTDQEKAWIARMLLEMRGLDAAQGTASAAGSAAGAAQTPGSAAPANNGAMNPLGNAAATPRAR